MFYRGIVSYKNVRRKEREWNGRKRREPTKHQDKRMRGPAEKIGDNAKRSQFQRVNSKTERTEEKLLHQAKSGKNVPKLALNLVRLQFQAIFFFLNLLFAHFFEWFKWVVTRAWRNQERPSLPRKRKEIADITPWIESSFWSFGLHP